MRYQGSCHCQAIQFSIEAPETLNAISCNCTICTKGGFLHYIIPLNDFHLVKGHDDITTYSFNTGIAKHTFCKHCGIKPFYTPRSNPDGIDINVNCLDTRPDELVISPFDGQHWEEHGHTLSHLSKD
ncbi:GFA family protein [Aurantivibrio plasticivorans]